MRKAVALLGVLAVAAMSPPPANAGCAPWCSPVSDLMPRWSADGTKLAYASGRGGVLVNVVIAKPDATSGIPLPDLPSPQQLSPDFSRYAFYTGYGDGTDLSVAEVGGSAHAIAHASPVFSPRIVPAWSPDRKLVAYTGPTGGVAVVGADGANPHEVLSGPASSVAWSPDARTIAVGVTGPAPALWTVEADGSNAQLVVTAATPLAEAWSPDGRSLAFVADPVGNLVTATLDMPARTDGSVSSASCGRAAAPPASQPRPGRLTAGASPTRRVSRAASASTGAEAQLASPPVEPEWDRFFDELYLETYASRLAAFDAEAEARAAIDLAGCGPGADVLDCPCGFGRHSIPLADMGYRVVGADRSPEQLEEAKRKAGDREWPRFVRADYRDLPFEDASFDAALNLFSGFGYYGEEADRRAFAEYGRVLRPGGALVLETMHRDRLMSIFREQDWEELPDGGIVFERRTFDPVAGEVETSHRLVRANGEQVSFDFRLRTYTATEIAAMLAAAGFGDVEFFGGLLEREPLSPQHRLVAIGHLSA